jgi:hypothetical protein
MSNSYDLLKAATSFFLVVLVFLAIITPSHMKRRSEEELFFRRLTFSKGGEDGPTAAPIVYSINFDDNPNLNNEYMGFNWNNIGCIQKNGDPNSGYENGATSGDRTAYSAQAGAFFYRPTGTFSLHSWQASSAWVADNVLDIKGYDKDNIEVATMQVTVQFSGPTFVEFGSLWEDLTKVAVTTSLSQGVYDDILVSYI